MNRRELLKTLAGVASLGVAAGVTVSPRKFGVLTVDGYSAHQKLTGEWLHVFVNGQDVTLSCYEADDIAGYALVWCRDEQHHSDWTKRGYMHVAGEGRGACRMRLTGDVLIVPGAGPIRRSPWDDGHSKLPKVAEPSNP